MVKNNSIPTQGIKLAKYYWGCIVTGAREQLVDQGLAQSTPFPGDTGANKWTLKTFDPQGRMISIKRLSANRFEISRDWNTEEAQCHKAAEEKRQAREEEIKDAKDLVESWPKSAAAFREDARWFSDRALRLFEMVFAEGIAGGYRYDDDTQLRARILADQMRSLIESGTVVMDTVLRDGHLPPCIASTVRASDAARRDKAFQSFLSGVAK